MTIEVVDDEADPRLDPVRDLIARRSPEVVVVEGFVAVSRALAGPVRVQRLLATASQLARLPAAALPESTLQLDAALMRRIVGFDFHRGALALVERPPDTPPDLDARLAAPFTAVVLQGLADPANVGAILRTAAALGAGPVVCAGGADPYERRALRACMGHALRQLPWRVAEVADALGRLTERGARVLALTTSPQAADIATLERAPGESLVLVLGNEGDGLDPATIARADAEVTIRLAPDTDSLNVAAAAAIAVHALR